MYTQELLSITVIRPGKQMQYTRLIDNHGHVDQLDIIYWELYTFLSSTENWLYDEEEDASKSVYVEKLDQLKTYGGPIAKRYHEAEERPKAVQLLQESIQSFILNAASNEERFSHIPEEEKKSIMEKATKHQNVHFASLIWSKPKPKPEPKPEEPKSKEPKTEVPKTEEPKPEEPNTEEPNPQKTVIEENVQNLHFVL
ncbi:hypothetical protein C2G38_2312685 [Gigaspora rosea]|uniref:Uncharacterized protein n=1 Tax=Gigaspora rosea TaxID=44941 RepID=A0A397V5H4_9GLOM|nr:hypothetical protein C2G38_2312685 [Gigaspora rosea]